MNVSQAVQYRHSVRAFLDRSIDNDLLKSLLSKASRAPSGGNLQPWNIRVLNGDSMTDFLKFLSENDQPQAPEYEIYPKELKKPYSDFRSQSGEKLYESLNIQREDKRSRYGQVLKNFEFFGAPAGLFCFIDKQMGPPQWADLGIFLQTFLLLSVEEGLGTCAQEIWVKKSKPIKEYFNVSSDYNVFCGVAIGYEDLKSPVNRFRTERRPIEEWCVFH